MRTALISINLLALIVLLALPAPTSAHVLKSDGDIGVVLHLDPEDEPVAGVVTPIFFAFKDTTGRFQFDACDCRLYVKPYAQKDLIDTTAAADGGLHTRGDQLSADATYLFPKPDVYALELVGRAKDGTSFRPFTVLFDVRVASYAEGTTPTLWKRFFAGHALHFVIFGGGFLFFLGAVLFDRRKRQL